MRKIFLAALALVLVPAGSAMASGLSLYGSYWNSSSLDDAAGAGAKFSIPLGSRLQLDLRGTYYEPFDEDVLRDQIEDIGDDEVDAEVFPGELSVIPIEAGLSVALTQGGSIRPTLGAGATYFLMDVDRGEIDDEVGWYANFAVDFASQSSFGFFTEAIYRSAEGTVSEDRDDLDFDRVAFDLDGVAVNAGVVFRF